jgi:SAM-dependent methyltransferase
MNLDARECGDGDVTAGRGPGQLPWYRFALRFVAGRTVLDVGTGLGLGLPILRERASAVDGQDLDERLAERGIRITTIDAIPANSYDVVTAIDVIEHIQDDRWFVAALGRIARTGVFVTTPNWTVSRGVWPYHIREYTPAQLEALLSPVGRVSLFKGTPAGDSVFSVRHRRTFHAFNVLRAHPVTEFPARCLNHLLPEKHRVHSHIGAWIEKSG